MESEDETDRVNHTSQLYSSQEPEPLQILFYQQKAEKREKKRSPRDYLNLLLKINHCRILF